jgi:hypothetical protein
MLDRQEERDRLVATLNRGSATGWNDDEPAVVAAAAELVLRRFFGPGEPDADRLWWLASVARLAMAEISRPLDEHHAEAVIRTALGESAPGIDALNPADRHVLRMTLASIASINMELDKTPVDELLREAERIAFERGFHPPLVPRGRAGAERS